MDRIVASSMTAVIALKDFEVIVHSKVAKAGWSLLKRLLFFFPGDCQNTEAAMKAAKCHQFITWSYENTLDILANRFPNRIICLCKPNYLHLNNFACYDAFVEKATTFGDPKYSPSVKSFTSLSCCIDTLCKEKYIAECIDEISVMGFSKGCIVLNQLVYEIQMGFQDENIAQFISMLREFYWLDGGHNGTAEIWISDLNILESFARINPRIYIGVTPYQMKSVVKSWAAKEKRKFVERLESGDFDDKEYVERLARVDNNVNLGPLKKPEEFCPDALLKSFQESIIVLNQLKTKNQKKVDKIEKQCYIIAKEHDDNLKKQRLIFQDSFRTYEQLELKVRTMAAKVVHLGDQLETANKKKNKTDEALQLIKYFNIFQRNEENETKLFSNNSQVFEAAKVLDILTSFATDLPDKYTEVRSRIEAKSRDTEKSLLKEFHHAHTHNDTERMRKCGQTLSLFPKFDDQSVSLSAVALSQAFINITGYFPMLTLTSAVDRLFTKSDVIGRNKYTGLLLQRSLLVNAYLMLPIAFIWLNTENIMLLLRQPPELSALAGEYVTVYIAILPALCVSSAVVKTLQLQEVIIPSLLILMSANFIEVVIVYPLAYFTDIGVRAFALGPVIAFYFIAISHCMYLRCVKIWKRIWCGFSFEAWESWCQYICYGVPLLLVNLLEIVSIQSGAFILGIASYQPVVDIGIHVVATCINSLISVSCMSLSLATSIRLSQLSYESQRKRIKKIVINSLIAIIIISLSQSVILAAGSQFWGRVFSSDLRVASGLANILFLLAAYHPFEGLLILFQAVLNGLRRHHVNSIFTLFFCVVSFPIAIILAMFLPDQALGYWVGITTGYFTRIVLYIAITIVYLSVISTVSYAQTRIKESTPLVANDIPQHTEIPCYISTVGGFGCLKWKIFLLKILLLLVLVIPFIPLIGCRYSTYKKEIYNISYIQAPLDVFCLIFLPFNYTIPLNQTI
ncbi:hypothetical protein LOD99_194 [Oopsacas minuta]|uniref:Multidrug and toxin extrusion protein n=1 Tax=Oopsacas minuta TaxID=111878 RepID=A0AAV7K8A0_9METZ|nr:hypothetical protein LOD99_194 [Oopsacas minuta]